MWVGQAMGNETIYWDDLSYFTWLLLITVKRKELKGNTAPCFFYKVVESQEVLKK